MAASTVTAADSATEARPRTTVTGPEDRSSRSGDGVGRHTGSIAGVARYGVDERSGQEVDLARLRVQRVGSDRAETGAGRGQLDQCGAVVDDGVTQAKEQRPEVFLGVGTDEDDGAARGAGLVDRGARQTQHRLGRKAVAELRIDMVGAEHALGELGPGVLRLVGERAPPITPMRAGSASRKASVAAARQGPSRWPQGDHRHGPSGR